jgi:hypothetical protein
MEVEQQMVKRHGRLSAVHWELVIGLTLWVHAVTEG